MPQWWHSVWSADPAMRPVVIAIMIWLSAFAILVLVRVFRRRVDRVLASILIYLTDVFGRLDWNWEWLMRRRKVLQVSTLDAPTDDNWCTVWMLAEISDLDPTERSALAEGAGRLVANTILASHSDSLADHVQRCAALMTDLRNRR